LGALALEEVGFVDVLDLLMSRKSNSRGILCNFE